MLIGTAGHIDHGKTSLIRRLTGRNTDRLPEEIKRGISIELGYAYVPLASGDVMGFIDVPGHEKFVHTMVAGATGIDLALLVVAADDGVMPQTQEHFEILRLLGVDDGAIALTKIDAVDAARADEVRTQLARWLAATPAVDWPVFPLSAVTGDGVGALDGWLRARAAAAQARAGGGHFRLAVDRVFTLAGAGTIVTGTAHTGEIAVGDEVLVQPRGRRARVRSLHVQDRAAQRGRAGQRCALNLAGVAKDDVARGDWVQTPPLDNLTDRFDIALRLSAAESKALAQSATVHLHVGTRDVLARISPLDVAAIAPGTDALATVSVETPMALCAGDRLIVRDASASRTIGGGRVLDIAPPVRGKRKPARLALLESLRDAPREESLQVWLTQAPLPQRKLVACWNLRDEESAALLQSTGAQLAAGTAFARAQWDGLRDRVLAAVADTHEREPEMPGLEQNRLRRIVAPSLDADALAQLVESLLAETQLARRGAFLALPSHKAELAAAERVLWERIKPKLMEQRYGPPRVRDIAREVSINEGKVRTLLKRVARVGEVTLVAHDHFFLTDAVATMAGIAAELIAANGAARAAEFRDRIGGGRKVAIQILEFFDRVGFTRRVRDDHLPRRDNPWRPETAGNR